MVRLKVLTNIAPERWKNISIPLGTIKSRLGAGERADKLISIPLGTIKSETDEPTEGRTAEFQYLLVRLKENFIIAVKYYFLISIPLGTIKSCNLYDPNRGPTVFQYLLVRLKVHL